MSHSVETAKSKDARPESWLKKLGPGLITGAADDDPSGIATYSQAGAQFGFSMLWTVSPNGWHPGNQRQNRAG